MSIDQTFSLWHIHEIPEGTVRMLMDKLLFQRVCQSTDQLSLRAPVNQEVFTVEHARRCLRMHLVIEFASNRLSLMVQVPQSGLTRTIAVNVVHLCRFL